MKKKEGNFAYVKYRIVPDSLRVYVVKLGNFYNADDIARKYGYEVYEEYFAHEGHWIARANANGLSNKVVNSYGVLLREDETYSPEKFNDTIEYIRGCGKRLSTLIRQYRNISEPVYMQRTFNITI
jgi:hypothetical protein